MIRSLAVYSKIFLGRLSPARLQRLIAFKRRPAADSVRQGEAVHLHAFTHHAHHLHQLHHADLPTHLPQAQQGVEVRQRVAGLKGSCDCDRPRAFPYDSPQPAGLAKLVEGQAGADNRLRVKQALEHPRIVDTPADHIAGRLDQLA